MAVLSKQGRDNHASYMAEKQPDLTITIECFHQGQTQLQDFHLHRSEFAMLAVDDLDTIPLGLAWKDATVIDDSLRHHLHLPKLVFDSFGDFCHLLYNYAITGDSSQWLTTTGDFLTKLPGMYFMAELFPGVADQLLAELLWEMPVEMRRQASMARPTHDPPTSWHWAKCIQSVRRLGNTTLLKVFPRLTARVCEDLFQLEPFQCLYPKRPTLLRRFIADIVPAMDPASLFQTLAEHRNDFPSGEYKLFGSAESRCWLLSSWLRFHLESFNTFVYEALSNMQREFIKEAVFDGGDGLLSGPPEQVYHTAAVLFQYIFRMDEQTLAPAYFDDLVENIDAEYLFQLLTMHCTMFQGVQAAAARVLVLCKWITRHLFEDIGEVERDVLAYNKLTSPEILELDHLVYFPFGCGWLLKIDRVAWDPQPSRDPHVTWTKGLSPVQKGLFETLGSCWASLPRASKRQWIHDFIKLDLYPSGSYAEASFFSVMDWWTIAGEDDDGTPYWSFHDLEHLLA